MFNRPFSKTISGRTVMRRTMAAAFAVAFAILWWIPVAASQCKPSASYIERRDKFHSQGDLDRAIADYTIAIQVAPNFALAYFNRALVRQEKGDLDASVADYTKALEIDPGSADAFVNRANVFGMKN